MRARKARTMAEIVNLKRARKAKARAAAEEKAAANRALHGTPKPLRELAQARKDKASQEVDAHKLDDDARD